MLKQTSRLSSNVNEIVDLEAAMPSKADNPGSCGASWLSTTAIVSAEVIGIGVLGMPFTVARLGWVAALSLIGFFCLANMYSCMLIKRLVCQFPGLTSFADLGGLVGQRSQAFASLSNNTLLAFIVVADFLVAASSLQAVVQGSGGNISLLLCGLLVIAIMLPIFQIQRLHGLSVLTIVGVVTVMLPLAITVARLGANPLTSGNGTATTSLYPVEPSLIHTGASLFTIIAAFMSQPIQVELMSEMTTPADYSKTIYSTHVLFFVVFAFVGGVVYAFAGDQATNPMTLQLQAEPLSLAIVNALLFIHVCVALSINACVLNQTLVKGVEGVLGCMWRRRGEKCVEKCGTDNIVTGTAPTLVLVDCDPGCASSSSCNNTRGPPTSITTSMTTFDECKEVNQHQQQHQHQHQQHGTLVWFGVSACTLLIAFAISNSVPGFGDLVDVIGASCGMLVSYIVPVAVALVVLEDVSKFERVCLWAVLAVSVPLMGVGVYASVALMVEDS